MPRNIPNMAVVRKRAAEFARELRAVKTPSLTMRERNKAIRSHVRQFIERERRVR